MVHHHGLFGGGQGKRVITEDQNLTDAGED